MIKVSNEKPDCWDRLVEVFGVDWDKGLVVTWKGKIHTKSGKISEQMWVHESVHLKQQEKYSPEEFLDRYIQDVEFRLAMELEAFRAEIEYINKTFSRPERRRRIDVICTNLSKNYGGMITYEEAKKIL